MALTLWADCRTGKQLDDAELKVLRLQARRVYEVNTHIFEDEADALTALGVVALRELESSVTRPRIRPSRARIRPSRRTARHHEHLTAA